MARLAGKLAGVNPPEREQRLVFGEIAEQYDAYRPSYPDALFDLIVEFAGVHAGDRALEIGAGTGKATAGFVARGLDVHALEPSPEMAAILRATGVEVEETVFESWAPPADGFPLTYAAQSGHWVSGDDRFDKAADTLTPGGAVAFFWNKGRAWTGALGDDNEAAYTACAPDLVNAGNWELDWVSEGIAVCNALTPPTKRVVTWNRRYTRDEWVQQLGTNSNHRLLPDEQRERLQSAVGDMIDRHGGSVEVVYDAECYLSRRAAPS
jgi:SAM-dependent methyltransferase